jgi:hypothetical protein
LGIAGGQSFYEFRDVITYEGLMIFTCPITGLDIMGTKWAAVDSSKHILSLKAS